MGRPSKGSAARRVLVTVRLTEGDVRALDAHRGGLSRSAYLRLALHRQVMPSASLAEAERTYRGPKGW